MLAIADRWFEITHIDDGVTLILEPHVDPLIRCNIWHIRGADRDLIVDSGLGIASLADAARHIFENSVTAVATHTHYDHVGGLHEFDDRIVHSLEAGELVQPDGFASLCGKSFDSSIVTAIRASGYEVPDLLVDALPEKDFELDSYRVLPAPATRLVEEGDVVDIGKRRFEVLHLPGHSPGSIGLWEEQTGILFSGDAVYDGPLLDELPGSDVRDYVRTMGRLLELPVNVVHAGHDPSFGRDRLKELARNYLDKRS